jgi:hypothetical protein
VLIADEHEAASAEVAGERVYDGESEVHGDCGVNGVASGVEDFEAGVGGVVFDGDDHGVRSADGLDVRLLGAKRGNDEEERNDKSGDAGGSRTQGLLLEPDCGGRFWIVGFR